MFKHALIQDAAYDSLLKRRRQELHGKIARVIEDHFPRIADTEPELLAHHFTEAKQHDKAIGLWQKAGSLALGRMALAEAIARLGKGLDVVAALPSSTERDSKELDLRTLLGTAWIAHGGWQVQEVWESLHPALRLATTLRRGGAMLPILWGLYANMVTTGRVAESVHWITEMLGAADAYQDTNLLILGHDCAVCSYFWLGELAQARQHAEQVLALYAEERHGHLANLLVNDPMTFCQAWTSIATWRLGLPEEALKISDARDLYARRLNYPFDLSFALIWGAWLFDQLGNPDAALKRLEEAERIGRENSLPAVTHVHVPFHLGTALIRKGRAAEGIAAIKSGLGIWEGTGGRLASPYLKSVIAEGMAQLGEFDSALDLIQESLAQVERPGWEERQYYPETLRIRGWLLALKGDLEGAERNYIASLDWARHQQAKSWELRTAISYARLMREHRRVREAYDLLAPIYGWFTQGFGTKDLKEAKGLLDELRDRSLTDAADQSGALPADRSTA